MSDAIFGFIGVIVGAIIPWVQTSLSDWKNQRNNAKYLAIRIVCILDKYLQDCAEVVKDDGLIFGQRSEEGFLQPQVKAPGPPIFPNDVDWKSIDHELMYMLLSFPSDVEDGDRIIKGTTDISFPPDFEDWFEERRYHYCRFGLTAYRLTEKLCSKYKIKKKTYNDWNPAADLEYVLSLTTEKRKKRLESYNHFVDSMLYNK